MFQRVGEATDVVAKEMYEFTDLGGRHVALRPEQTASVCRAFVAAPPDDAVEGVVRRPELPLREAAARPLPAVRPGRHRGARRRRPVPRRRGHRPRLALLRRARPAPGDAAAELARRARRPGPLRRRAARPLRGPPRRAHAPRAARRSTATRCASSTPSAPQDAAAHRRRAADRRLPRATRRPSTSPPCAAGLDALGIPYSVEPRLVRGLDYYLRTTFEFAGGTLDGGAERARRRRPLRRARRGARRPADARRRVRARASTARCWRATTRACSPRRPTPSTCSSSTPPAAREALAITEQLRRGRASRRSRLRRPQHEGADEGRRPQRRRDRRHRRRRRAGRRHRRRAPAAAASGDGQTVVARTDLLTHLEARPVA